MACQAQGANMKIVENGKSDYVILTLHKANPAEELAAQELAGYIEKMSGAKLQVRTDGVNGSTPALKKAIVINDVSNAGPHTDYDRAITGEQYQIRADGSTLIVTGGRGRAVLYAVYDLLDRSGCRFLAPKLNHYQGTAEIVPKMSSLSIDLSAPIVEKPVLAFRKLYVEEGHSHNAENLAQMAEWMPKARFNTLVVPTDYSGRGAVKWDNWREKLTPELQKRDITIEVGGHGYQNFLNAEMEKGNLFTQHSDWFGVDESGSRTKSPNRVFCTSNAEAMKYLADNVIAYLKARPEIEIFDFWPPDGAHWCACDKCKDLGTPSNRQAILISQVKSELRKAGVNTRLETIAYAAAVTPPESAKLEKDLLMDFCPIAQCFEVQINDLSSDKNADYVKQLAGLRKGFEGDLSIYSYYRKYAWKSLPNLIPHYMQRDLKFYVTVPVQGVSSYAEPGDWFTYELNHYTLGKLAWNPWAGVDGIITKFAEARYGSASQAAIHAYGVLEDVIRHDCCIPGSTLKSLDEETKAGETLVKEMDALKAAQSRVTDPGIRRNIDRFLLTFEYARLDIEVQKAKAADASDAEIQRRVKTVADFLSAHETDGITNQSSREQLPRLQKTYTIVK